MKKEDIKKALDEALLDIDKAKTIEILTELRNEYLSKRGVFSSFMGMLRNLSNEEKPQFGQLINIAKTTLENAINERRQSIEDELLFKQLATEKIDITLPSTEINKGSIHPLNQVIEDVEDLFIGLGYEIVDGPEVERDYYNFEMMNIGKDHPAREMQDSFFINESMLLRTHTSPVQARTMLERKGQPLKIIAPGKTYRRDDDDLTHSHQFMQIEGLVIDKDISFANLKETLLKMVKSLFGNDREIRLRPSYFPFTEPSVEVDVVYYNKDGSKGYIEVLGAGLVHPEVLKMGGYDPKEFSGFAFGIGVERIAILKYGIDDIRNFYVNDLRFLKQFSGDDSYEN